MITKVQRWGNSQGLRLSRELLSNAVLNVGDAVEGWAPPAVWLFRGGRFAWSSANSPPSPGTAEPGPPTAS
jgi:hypothetical protein